MSKRIVEKSFYFPSGGTIEEFEFYYKRIKDYLDEHDWVAHPHYQFLDHERIEIVGFRELSETTGETPVVKAPAKKKRKKKETFEDIMLKTWKDVRNG